MKKYTDDTTQLISEKDKLKDEYERIKSELSSRLNNSEQEVCIYFTLEKYELTCIHQLRFSLENADFYMNSL